MDSKILDELAREPKICIHQGSPKEREPTGWIEKPGEGERFEGIDSQERRAGKSELRRAGHAADPEKS